MSTRGSPLEHDHSREGIAARLESLSGQSYVRDWVYGGIDGAVTTFAVVAGVAGADLPAFVILVLGGANLVADGFSMAASNYSGTRAEVEEVELARSVERKHVHLDPEGEREEVRQIFARKGFTGEDLERAVDVITADIDRWVRTMIADEYGLPLEVRSPMRAALSTFTAFVICGLVPLLPYLVGLAPGLALAVAAGLTGGVFFLIGSLRSRWSVRSWWAAGLETLGIGAAAAGLAYLAGYLIGRT